MPREPLEKTLGRTRDLDGELRRLRCASPSQRVSVSESWAFFLSRVAVAWGRRGTRPGRPAWPAVSAQTHAPACGPKPSPARAGSRAAGALPGEESEASRLEFSCETSETPGYREGEGGEGGEHLIFLCLAHRNRISTSSVLFCFFFQDFPLI